MSSSEAKEYGDKVFQQMMYTKAVAVQLVNWLGYNVLFQDVDVVWYKNPLDFLRSSHTDYDVLFQEDGARSVRYAPYSANSGFYFIRYNEKTRHLLTRMLCEGDTIMTSGSHQQALNTLLAEHTSLYGLRVKVLSGRDFPGGFQFHRDQEYMRELLVKRTSEPSMFHMSWTKNKQDKKLFFEQMGDWYVKDKCIGGTADKILNGTGKAIATDTDLAGACCMAKPEIKCHYRDKPSKIPCKDAPPMDKGRGSWW